MSADWLPPLVLLEDSGGDWKSYEEVLYGWFTADFLKSQPRWPGKRVGLKRHPMSQDKEATFWHFISEGETEADRLMDMRRCERIRWPHPMMRHFRTADQQRTTASFGGKTNAGEKGATCWRCRISATS